ncbi:MAG: glycoside hydrolase family 43 protein [Chloroflexota bacterium]
MNTSEIHIRDPFVLPVAPYYYLYGTTDADCWKGPGEGFNCFRSTDLESWEGPFAAFRSPEGFWATKNFWAPEVHAYRGRYYMLASFKAPQRYRGTQILVAERPEGPFIPLGDGPITPDGWECLDGTLHVDRQSQPWIVFCNEWVQVHNGSIYALPLSDDLERHVGRPVYLFNASEAPWARPFQRAADKEKSSDSIPPFPCYVTDGPFLHCTADGVLLMLWSSMGDEGYTMGVARSRSGHITGPWVQQETPLWGKNGGHGMVFRSFDDRLYLALHTPNETPLERAKFIPVEEAGHDLRIQ